jgi:hypothetical protein
MSLIFEEWSFSLSWGGDVCGSFHSSLSNPSSNLRSNTIEAIHDDILTSVRNCAWKETTNGSMIILSSLPSLHHGVWFERCLVRSWADSCGTNMPGRFVDVGNWRMTRNFAQSRPIQARSIEGLDLKGSVGGGGLISPASWTPSSEKPVCFQIWYKFGQRINIEEKSANGSQNSNQFTAFWECQKNPFSNSFST